MLSCICFACVCTLQQAIVPKFNTNNKKKIQFSLSLICREGEGNVWENQRWAISTEKIKTVPRLGNIPARQQHLHSFTPLPSVQTLPRGSENGQIPKCFRFSY